MFTEAVFLLIVSAVFCGAVGRAKGRGFFGWAILGFCFPVISLLALIAMPAAQESDGDLNFER